METMMKPFLETLGRNSVEAGILVLAVLVAQRLFGKKIGPKWRCALWLLVMVRLLLPVSVSSVASVFNLFPRLENLRPTVAVPSISNERLPAPSPGRLSEAVRATDANPNQSASGSPELQPQADARALANSIPGVSALIPVQISWLSVIFTTWLTGTLFCGGYILVSSLNMRRQFANLARVVDGDLLDLLRDCRDQLGIREELSLVESPDVATPALYGFFKPKLLLPRGFIGRFSRKELRFILLHELAHVKRRDILFNWLAAGLQILHWFNPLIWFGFARWRLDRELACDALALETAGGAQNKEYGETILRLVENFTHRTAVPGLIGILEDKKQLQWRIRMIAGFRPGRKLGLVAVALFAVLGLVCLTDAQNKSTMMATQATNAVSAAVATGTAPGARPAVTNELAMKVTVLDDATGQALDNAEVLGPNQATFFGGRENAPRWLTDQSGTAVMRLGEPPTNTVWQMSWFTLSVRKEGYAASGMSWSDGSADVRLGLPKEITVRLKYGTTAGGVVVDESGAPQPGIQVRVYGNGYSYARWQEQKQGYSEFWNDGVGAKLPVTDAAGRWQVKDFPTDLPKVAIELVRPDGSVEKFRYPAEAVNPNEPQGAPMDLEAMMAGTARFVLKSGVGLQGLTVDSRGRPVPGVRIKLGYGMVNVERAGEVRSDASGHFVLQHLNHRQVILTAEASGYAVTSLIVDLHSNLPEARLQLDDVSPLRIHVVDGDGKVIAGAKVTAGAYRTEGQLLDFTADTDEHGDLTWTNAPRSKYALATESSAPALRQKIYLTPGQHEVTFHLRAGMDKEIIINGQVHDAKTGAAVKLESVKYQDGNRRGFQYDAEVSKSGFHLALQARWLRSGMYPSFQLQIKAAGYGTLTTPWRDYDEGDWDASFTLQPAEAAGGIVSLPDGRPAGGTHLWTRAEDIGDTLFMNQPGRYYGDRMIKAQADEAGRYTLPEVPDAQPVIFTDAGGFLATSAADVRHNPNVHLQPWGRVEGILKIAGQPKGNVGISLETLLWSPKMGYQVNYRTTTTAKGNFVFTNIPAGEYKFYRDPVMRTGRAITEDHQMPLVVKAGETTKIEYSNVGRAVIGQARADKAALAVDWLNDDHTLTLKQPALEKVSVNPKDFATSEAYQAAYDDSYHSPERLKQSREARIYVLAFEGDGSFRADDVPAGTYELKIQVTKPDPNAHFNPFGPGHVLGSMTREVVVPPGDSPFDLGTLVVPMKGDGERMAPVHFAAQTLDGKPISLDQFKGKYVLLAFWAMWSERSTEQLAELQKLQTELSHDSRIAFLGACLDGNASAVHQTVESRGYHWTQTCLSSNDLALATAAFDVNALPAVYLIDPQGQIVGRNIEANRLRETVRRVFQK